MTKLIITIEEVPGKGVLTSYDTAKTEPSSKMEEAVSRVMAAKIAPVIVDAMQTFQRMMGGSIGMVQTELKDIRENYKKRFRE